MKNESGNNPQNEKHIQLILNAKLDWSDYSNRYSVDGSVKRVANHYIHNWHKVYFIIPGVFDSRAYLTLNPDIKEKNANPLLHFLLFGREEGRLAIFSKDSDHQCILDARLDWSLYIDRYNLKVRKSDPYEAVLHFLENYPMVYFDIEDEFDSRDYLTLNPDLKDHHRNLLAHYIRHGRKERRPSILVSTDRVTSTPNSDKKSKSTLPAISPKAEAPTTEIVSGFPEILSSCKDLDWDTYKLDFQLPFDADPIQHYLENWREIYPCFHGFFDTNLYLDLYPDINETGQNPLLHFIQFGENEGRAGWLDREMFFVNGGKQFNKDLDTILVACHETSNSGAPVLGLEISRNLSTEFNVITVGLKKGILNEDFIEAGFLHINEPYKFGKPSIKFVLEEITREFRIHAVLLNSVECFDFLIGLTTLSLPTVTLIHEYTDYTRPIGKTAQTLTMSDIVVYPAESLRQSGLKELRECFGFTKAPNNIWIKPQGYMSFNTRLSDDTKLSLRQQLKLPDDTIIITGAGHIQPRKGLDWFFETAMYLCEEMKYAQDDRLNRIAFVWLGSGYAEAFGNVTAWLESFFERTNIKDKIYFTGHVDSVSSALKDSDIYLLTSKLDPFPNVAIDALEADCGIGCFHDASGIADFLEEHESRSVIAPYGNCHLLAKKIYDSFNELTHRNGTNNLLCQSELSFESYINALKGAMSEASWRRGEINNIIDSCEPLSKRFDGDFYELAFVDTDPQYHFLSFLQKGLVASKPFPGSSIQRTVSTSHPKPGELYPLVEEIMTENTPDLIVIDGANSEKYQGRVALQFHIYYADLIPEYTAYFNTLKGHNVDLFVSHIPELSDAEKELLRNSVEGETYFDATPNLGRDVYPFHQMLFKIQDSDYDLVGHFHTKKSIGYGDGAGWRRYLLGNLAGSHAASKQVLSLFSDESIGLVFAEDRHSANEGLNLPYIEKLLQTMDIPTLDSYHDFPLGTMFWARVKALDPLLILDKDIFKIEEPVPYDGSYLHAFERIIPQIISFSGYKAKQVYTRGTKW